MVTLAGIFFYRQIVRTLQITVVRTEAPLISPGVVFIPNSDSEQSFGNPGANIIVTEFVDLGCARCLSLHSAIKQFVFKHPQDIRLIWKDNPRAGILSDYNLAHQAAYCAGKQNKFWEFIGVAKEQRNNLAEAGLKKIALDLNLNTESWWLCVNSPETKQAIDSSVGQAAQLGIRSLPAIFVNNKMINTDKDVNMEEMLTNFIVKPEN
jgi:protein-disulfide isomerase